MLARTPIALLLGLAVLAGCGDPAPPVAKPVSRVLLVGMDGLEWSVVQPLLVKGRMPNLLALMQRGSYGYLASMKPTLSPVVWTTIATGKLMEDHKITSFLDEHRQVFTSGRRAVSAVWNIADHYGLSTNLFGWFVTWPAEHVRGMVVSGSSADSQLDANWKPALLPGVKGQVWPEGMTDEVLALAAQAGSIEKVQQLASKKIFPGVQQELMDPLQKKVLQQTLWSVLSDETYFEIAVKSIKEHPADLNLVYFGGTDVVGHRYWREFRPKGYTWHDGEVLDKELAEVVNDYYAWMDEMLGALVAAAGPDATVFVVSDHGMHAVAQEKEDTEFGMTGHHLDAPPGVIVAAGPAILKQGGVKAFLENGALPTHGSVVDVTPTLLALLGIPVGKDMRGRAVLTLLAPGPARDNAKLPPVASHDEGFRPPAVDDVPAEMSTNFEEHFRALGYLDLAPHEGASEIVPPPAPAPQSPAPPAPASDPH